MTTIRSMVVRGSIVSLFLLSLSVKAQKNSTQQSEEQGLLPLKYNASKAFKPFIAAEAWGTYNMKEDSSDSESDQRFDTSLRRLRFGASGTPYPWLKYVFQFYADRLGEDDNAFTKGSYSGIGIWDAYISAKLLKNSDLLYLHAGYYWTAISRQFNTSPWAVGSFDKTRADWYLRYFIAGKGNGTESGFGLGGLKNYNNFGISYRIGSYEPDAYTSSQYADRLYTGRLMLSFGDPEQKQYKYMLSGNQWGKRRGITLGLGAASQNNGQVDENTYWNQSKAYGSDILINYDAWRIDGEYYRMKRTASNASDFEGSEFHVYVGYNIPFKETFIEPSFTYEKYKGEGNSDLFSKIGDDITYDIGANWYLDGQRLKLSLHYVIQKGSISSALGNFMGTAIQIKL